VTVCVVFFQPDPIEAVSSVVTGAMESATTANVALDLLPTLSYTVTLLLAPLNVAATAQV
jgi:hypothetical protein